MGYSDPKLWFSFEGRVNRRPYFFAGLAVACLTEGTKLVPSGLMLFYLPFLLLAIYVGLALGVKRCHDRGKTGFFLLLNIVPLLNLWPFVELVFLKGETGANKYGTDPLEGTQ